MKRVLSLVLAAVMVLSMFAGLQISSSALESTGRCGENVYYTFDESTGTLTISGEGDMDDYGYDDFSPFYDNSDIISIVIEDGVTSIGQCSFSCCTNLTSIEIPNSVTSIGKKIFEGCTGLTTVRVLEGNGVYDSRDNCDAIIKTSNNELIAGCKSTVIPNSVTRIGEYAFFECNTLLSVYIPKSVISIGDDAFGLCSGLTNIAVSEENSIYDSRKNCNAIIKTASNELIIGCKSTVIPNSVTTIGFSAFSFCSGIESITIPNSVTNIEDYAFNGCSNLTSITIGKELTNIGDGAFTECWNLTDIYYSGTQADWSDVDINLDNECLTNATIHYNYDPNHIHSYTDVVTQPTCTEQGYTTHICEYGDSYNDTYVPALGHDFSNNAEVCRRGCGTKNPDYIPPVPAHVHSYKAVVTAPKANAVGYTRYKCACGEWKKDTKGNIVKATFKAPTGKPSGFKCASRTATAEKFTWTKTAGASGYQVQISNAKGNAWGTSKVLTANSYTFSKLTAGSAYKARVRFYIKAADGKNYYGAWTTITSPTLPAGTSLVKVTGAKKAFTAQWKKGAVTGYQLQYAANNKFSGAKNVTIKKAATLKYSVSKLAANKTFYVRVRTYKAISGANYYSAWSAVKAVKTK